MAGQLLKPWILVLTGLSLLIAGCETGGRARMSLEVDTENAPVRPRDLYLPTAIFNNLQVSPAGDAYLVRQDLGGETGYRVYGWEGVDGRDIELAGLKYLSWAEDSRSLLALTESKLLRIALPERVWAVSGKLDLPTIDITPSGFFRWRVMKWPDDLHKRLLVLGQRRKNEKRFSFFWCGVVPPVKCELAVPNVRKGDEFGFDANYQVVWRRRATEDGLFEWHYRRPNGLFKHFATLASDESLKPLTLPVDGANVWALSNRNRDKTVLVKLDLLTGEETPANIGDTGHADWDMEQAVVLHRYDQPFATVQINSRQLIVRADASGRFDVDDRTAEPYNLTFASRNHAGDRVAVRRNSASGWGQYLLVDFSGDLYSWRSLTPTSREKPPAPFSETEAHNVPTRDGLQLPAYVTLPTSKPAEAKPLVLMLHGGPWSRYYPAGKWFPYARYLASQGYAVVRLNYRGSTGQGKAALRRSYGQLFTGIQNDILDAVDWANKTLPIDPNRVAVMGDSFGGWSALLAVTKPAHPFGCVVSIGGVTDSIKFAEFAFGHPANAAQWRKALGGGPELLTALKNDISPIHRVEKIDIPVLLMAGAKDRRVGIGQAVALADKLAARGIPHHLRIYQNEGHGLNNFSNLADSMARTGSFLRRCFSTPRPAS